MRYKENNKLNKVVQKLESLFFFFLQGQSRIGRFHLSAVQLLDHQSKRFVSDITARFQTEDLRENFDVI